MNPYKMMEAITNVLRNKLYLIDSLITQETLPGISPEDGLWQRTISVTFTEILRDGAEPLPTVREEIVEEYNRLTAYDIDVVITKKGAFANAKWLESKSKEL